MARRPVLGGARACRAGGLTAQRAQRGHVAPVQWQPARQVPNFNGTTTQTSKTSPGRAWYRANPSHIALDGPATSAHAPRAGWRHLLPAKGLFDYMNELVKQTHLSKGCAQVQRQGLPPSVVPSNHRPGRSLGGGGRTTCAAASLRCFRLCSMASAPHAMPTAAAVATEARAASCSRLCGGTRGGSSRGGACARPPASRMRSSPLRFASGWPLIQIAPSCCCVMDGASVQRTLRAEGEQQDLG